MRLAETKKVGIKYVVTSNGCVNQYLFMSGFCLKATVHYNYSVTDRPSLALVRRGDYLVLFGKNTFGFFFGTNPRALTERWLLQG